MAYITTEGRCSRCDEALREFESAANKLAIARQHEMEKAREGWLKETERVKELEKQLAEAQAACAAKDAVLNWACDCPPGDHAHQCQQALDEALRQAKSSTCGQS